MPKVAVTVLCSIDNKTNRILWQLLSTQCEDDTLEISA